jgi:cytoskeletal protein CcmA (bactofilin family)
MRRQFTRAFAAILGSTVLLLATAASAVAAEWRTGDRVVVGSDETISGDLYVAAATTVIDGTVDGDLTAASGTVEVRGNVTGSVNATGGTLTIAGKVGGAARTLGGNLTVSGSVGRDVVAAGGNVVIEVGATVGGDVAGGTGSLVIDGSVEGNVLAGAGELTVSGTVGGNIDANVGRLRIQPDAVIKGHVHYASERDAEIADGAQIAGDVQRREPDWAGYRALLPNNPITAFVGGVLGLLVLGWGLMLIRPGWVTHPGMALRARPLAALGAGLATWIGQFLLLIVLGVLGALAGAVATSFGGAFAVPVIITVLAIVIFLFVSQVYVAMAIGDAVGGLGYTTAPLLAYAIGALVWALVLTLLGWLLPALGALVFLAGWILGLGAFALDTLDRRRRDRPAWRTTTVAEPAG